MMFIETETTPDPARLTFLPGREVLADGALHLQDKMQAANSPLAERLFAIPGISAVSFDKESITVTKVSGDWQNLKPAILGAIMEHFMSGAPVLRKEAVAERPAPASSLAATGKTLSSDRVKEALRQVIDPELGYNIVDLGFVYDIAIEAGGVVRITMTTTTPGCPATNYLKQGAGDSVIALDGVDHVEVNLTHQPRWTPEAMSAEAKMHFGIGEG